MNSNVDKFHSNKFNLLQRKGRIRGKIKDEDYTEEVMLAKSWWLFERQGNKIRNYKDGDDGDDGDDDNNDDARGLNSDAQSH